MWQQASSRFGLASPREQRTIAEINVHTDDTFRAVDQLSGSRQSLAVDQLSGSRQSLEGICNTSSPSMRRFDAGSHGESMIEGRSTTTSAANHELIREITTGVLEGINRNAFWDRHTEMLETINRAHTLTQTINRVQAATPDFTPVLQTIQQLGLRERHSELVEAITNITVEPTDLRPILAAVEDLGRHQRHSDIFEALDSLRMAQPDLVSVQTALRELHGDLQAVLVESRRDLAAGFEELRQDLASLRREVSEGRKESRADSDVSIGELRSLPQVLGDMTQLLRKLDRQTDNTEVIRAVREIDVKPDLRQIADVVHERFLTADKLHVDNADMLHAMRQMEQTMHERFRATDALHVDSAEALQQSLRRAEVDYQAIANVVVDKLRGKVDHDAIASSVCERLCSTILNVDHANMLSAFQESHAALQEVLERRLDAHANHAPVLEALRRIQIPDHETIATAMHDRMRLHTFTVDNSEVLRAIRSIEIDMTPVHDAICRINVDHTPIFDAIKRIVVPDAPSIANAVHEKLRKHVFSVDQGDVLRAISKINTEPDLTPLLRAISAAEVDLSPVLDAVSRINVHVDHAPVVEAVKRISMPDVHTLATIVIDKMRKSAMGMEQSEIVEEIRQLRLEPDLAPVMGAINGLVSDVSSLAEAITRIHRVIDYGPLLEAVKRINMPDVQSLANAVVDHITRSATTRDEQMLQQIRATRVDLGPLIQAINSAEVDLSPVLESITALGSVVLSLKEHVKVLGHEQRIVETVVPQVVETMVPQVIETVQAVPQYVETVRGSPQVVERLETVMPYERGSSPLVSRSQRTQSPLPVQRVLRDTTPRVQQRRPAVETVVQRPLELGAPRPVEYQHFTTSTPNPGSGQAQAHHRASYNEHMSPMLSPTPSVTSIPMTGQVDAHPVLSGMEQTFQEGMDALSPDKRSSTPRAAAVDRMLNSAMDGQRARASLGGSNNQVSSFISGVSALGSALEDGLRARAQPGSSGNNHVSFSVGRSEGSVASHASHGSRNSQEASFSGEATAPTATFPEVGQRQYGSAGP